MANKRILSFAPYGLWNAHHQLDAVVGTALRLRGAEVRVLLCDGQFKDCLLAGKPHDPQACVNCRIWAHRTFERFPLERQMLFSTLTAADYEEAEAWADSVPVSGHAEAEYQGVAVGRYVAASLRTYTMTSEIDYQRASSLSASRNFLRNGALMVPAVRRHLEAYRPDHVLLFNGVHHYYRVFFEICRAQGIPVLVHEAGITYRDFVLLPNFHNFDHVPRHERYRPWSDVPLDAAQCAQVKGYFGEREKNVMCGQSPIYGYDTDPLKVKQALRIPEGKKVVACFTSSDWEVGIAKCHVDFTFPTQLEWLRETARVCAREGWFLVIRHHPNNSRKDLLCKDFLKALLRLAEEFGDDVRVIMPAEKITSYGLIWNVDVAVSLITTMGAEASMRGVPSVCVANSIYREMGMDYVRRPGDYAPALRKAMERPRARALEDLKQAYRYGHHMFFGANLAFKSFRIKNSGMDILVSKAEELLPGRDPAMDAVCDYMLEGKPLLEAPIVDAASPLRRAEGEFLERELDALDARRAEVRAASHWDPSAEPLVSVLRFRPGREEADKWGWEAQFRRSRHKRTERIEAPVAPGGDFAERLEALAKALEGARGEYAYIASPHVLLDECILSASSDLLSDPRQQAVQAITWGGWVCDPGRDIIEEVFARDEWETWEDAIRAARPIRDPFALMGLAVFRTAQLRRWLREWRDSGFERGEDLAEAVHRQCFAKSSPCHAMRVPLLWMFPEVSDADAPAGDLAFLFRITGDLGRAAQEYLAAMDENPGDESLAVEYAKVMEEMGRGEEARKTLAIRSGKGRPAGSAPAFASATGTLAPPRPPDGAKTSGSGNDWRSGAALDRTPAGEPPVPRDYSEIKAKLDTVPGRLPEAQEEFLFEKVRSLPDGAAIIVLGAGKGGSACAMAFACVGTRKKIYTIDAFPGGDGRNGRDEGAGKEWSGNLERLGLERYAIPLAGFPRDVLPQRDRFPAPHFAFIDASQDYWDALEDFKGIYDYVADGGWIAFRGVEAASPGPWRVWEEYGRHLLSDHQFAPGLVCGRKAAARPFGRAPGAGPGFSYAEAFLREMETAHGPASPLCQALRTSLAGRQGGAQETQALRQAELRLAEAPEPGFRRTLAGMMSMKDPQIDGHIRLWYGLSLIAEGKPSEALAQFRECARCSHPIPASRVAPYAELILSSVPGPFPEPPGGSPRAADFREYARPGDTVVEFRSGTGGLLRGIECARKLGVEPDRGNRKRAVAESGIDGAAAIGDLPDACADLILIHEGLADEEAPLAALRALRAKLKRGGRAACVMRPSAGGGGLYAWDPPALANMMRAAGFVPRGEPARGPQGELRLLAENP